MSSRQVEGVDAHNFPDELQGHPMLGWMGEDYVRFIIVELLLRFRQQDAGTEMLAIKSEDQPRLSTHVDEQTGTVRGVVVELGIQVLLQSSSGQYWRLKGDSRFIATGLDQSGRPAVSMSFDIKSHEEVK